jgi:hypothetical protein
MGDLQRLANERWSAERRIRTALAEGLGAAEAAQEAAAAEIERRFNEVRAAATVAFERTTAEARRRYELDRNEAQQQYKGLRRGVESEAARVKEAALNEQRQASWEALTVFDALKGRPRERYLETVRRLERANQEIAVLEHDARTIMKMRRQWREFPSASPSSDGRQPPENSRAHRVVFSRPAESERVVQNEQKSLDDLVDKTRQQDD